MKTVVAILAISFSIASIAVAADATMVLPEDISVNDCTVPAGTSIHVTKGHAVKSVIGNDGSCIAIPVGSRLSMIGSAEHRIDMPDGGVLRVPAN